MRSLRKEDIYIENNFVEELVDNPDLVEKYTANSINQVQDNYDLLLQSGLNSIRGYKIFDYLLLNMTLFNDILVFEYDLMENGVYYDYIESVVRRDNKFLKAYMYTYLYPNEYENIYDNCMDVAKDLVNEGDYGVDYRTNALVKLIDLDCSDALVKYVRLSIKKLLREDIKVRTMRTDEEIENYIGIFMKQIDTKLKGKDLVMSFVE